MNNEEMDNEKMTLPVDLKSATKIKNKNLFSISVKDATANADRGFGYESTLSCSISSVSPRHMMIENIIWTKERQSTHYGGSAALHFHHPLGYASTSEMQGTTSSRTP